MEMEKKMIKELRKRERERAEDSSRDLMCENERERENLYPSR